MTSRLGVLIVSINYEPEQTGFAPHIAALAKDLAAHGHEVTVATGFPFAPQWRRWNSHAGLSASREEIDGVEVIRSSHFIPRRPSSVLQRVWMETTFARATLRNLRRSTRRSSWNVLLYCGAQPGVAMLVRFLAWRLRRPYVVSIQDLAAQAAGDVGMVRQPMLAAALARFEFAAYSGARRAFVLCEAFRESLIARGFPGDAIDVVPSPIDVEWMKPVAASAAFRERHGIGPDDFVVLFAGSMGLKQGLENVVDAARAIRSRATRIAWVLIGDGDGRERLEHQISAHALQDRVTLLPLQPREELPSILATADLLLLNQIGAVKTTVVPSKLLTYMAAGKPVLAAVGAGSQGAAILLEAQGGVVIKPDDPEALAEAVVSFRDRPRSELDDMGRRNRAYALAHFDSRAIVALQERVLMDVVFGHRAPGQIRLKPDPTDVVSDFSRTDSQ